MFSSAVRQFGARSFATASRRTMATTTSTAERAIALNQAQQTSFKKYWLSDPATYPIMVVISGALCFMCGVSAKCITTNPDVKIAPGNRKTMMR